MWVRADDAHLALPPLRVSCLQTFVPGFHYTININTKIWAKGEYRRKGVGSRSENAFMFLAKRFLLGTYNRFKL